jgi:hypothetical protein
VPTAEVSSFLWFVALVPPNARVQLRANISFASEASYRQSPVGCNDSLCRGH